MDGRIVRHGFSLLPAGPDEAAAHSPIIMEGALRGLSKAKSKTD